MVGAAPFRAVGWSRRLAFAAALSGAVATLLGATASPAGATAPKVSQLRIDGVINVFSADYITGGISRAEADQADSVLITMDTPGGIDSSMRKIIQAILATRLPVVVYVSPSGARAASAGLFIAQAADVIAMAPGTNIGSAHPVLIGGSGAKDPTQQIEDQKVLNDSVAYIQSLAAVHHRNTDWVADAVRNSANVTAEQAVSLHVVDMVSGDTASLLRDIDGRQITKQGQTTMMRTRDAAISDQSMGPLGSFLHALADPQVSLLLLLLAILAIGMEVIHPGAILPGVTGVLAGILALVSLETLPVSYAGIALILFAVVFFAIDVRAPTHGVLTVGGVVALAIGSYMVLDAAGPYLRPNLALAVIPPVGVGLVLAFFVARAAAARRRPIAAGPDRLIGIEGEAREDLGPAGGLVMVDGALWKARSATSIPRGTRVRVKSISGISLEVESTSRSLHDGETPAPSPRAATSASDSGDNGTVTVAPRC